jgi:hypothetical protein
MTDQPDQLDQPALTVAYTNDWRWSSQAPPPINGQIRTDTRDWSTATHVFISNKTEAGLDVGSTLLQVAVGTTLDLSHRTDPTRTVRYTVRVAPVSQGTYVDVAVTYVQSAGTIPISGTLCTLAMALPANALTITWTLQAVALRANRYTLTCSCPHGTVAELCATLSGLPAPTPLVIQTTASNLLRRTGCTCAGLVQGAVAQEDLGVAGL